MPRNRARKVDNTVNAFNKITTAFFDVLFFPVRQMSDFWRVFIFAILTGLFMLWIFKKVSDQEGIRATKNRLKAHLLAIRLYRHDALLSLNAMGHLFLENGRYMLYLFKPILVMLIPVMIILIQLGARYGHRPAPVDQPILVAVRVAEDIDAQQVALVAPDVQIETAPLFIPQEKAIYWRVRPLRAGSSILTFHYGDETVDKKLVGGGNSNSPLAAKRVRAASLAAFFHPAESTLAATSFVREIRVDYPEGVIRVGGRRIHWLVFFFVVSLASGFLAKGLLKVHL